MEITMSKLVSWIEIPTVDFNRAVDFYTNIMQIDLEVIDSGEEKMACFPTGEGAISNAKGFKPSKNGLLVSLNTKNDLDETILRIEKRGGQIVQPKSKIQAKGRGCFAIFIDCEGNKIGLYGDE